MRRWIIAGGVIVVVAAGWLVLRPRAAVVPTKTVTVALGTVSSKVSAPGDVVPEHQTTLYTKTGATVADILVQAGQPVQPGQLLMRLRAPGLRSQITAQQAQVNALAANQSGSASDPSVQLAEAGVRQASLALADAQLALRRAQADYNLGAIAAQQLDQARAAVQQAQVAVQSAQLRVTQARTAGAGVAAQLASARAQMQLLQGQLATNEVRAPLGGTLINLPVTLGQAVPIDGPLAQVANLSSWLVQSRVSENDLPSLKLGMPVDVSVSALPNSLKATVIRIGQVKQYSKTNSNYYYDVVSRLTSSDPALASGMSATADFITKQANRVPTVPLKALQTVKGQTVAELYTGGKRRLVPVQTGIDNGTLTAVTAGLKPGDVVVLPPPPGSAAQAPGGLNKVLGF